MSCFVIFYNCEKSIEIEIEIEIANIATDIFSIRRYSRLKRANCHYDYGNVVMIENPLCYSNRFKRGDFWLYKESNIEKYD